MSDTLNTDKFVTWPHCERMRALDLRYYNETQTLRDRIGEIEKQGDQRALNLARDIQVYKDEKANELRSQIERERGTYATHNDLQALSDRVEVILKPVLAYVASQSGARAVTTTNLVTWLGLAVVLLTLWLKLK